ncbi:Inositol transport system permease protein [Candidatus Paraburkholderia calva]|nr:Inositol transport system permease protein [Candidatus Paraburkholderia calva]
MGVAGKHYPPHANPQQDSAEVTDKMKPADERVRQTSWFGHLLNRPEFAAISGTVLVFIVFGFGAGSSGMFNLDGVINWSQVAVYLGILAVDACLLMIAGEFDLSIVSIMFADRTIISGVGDLAQADPVSNALFHGVAFHGLFTSLAHMGIGKLLDSGEPLVPGIPKVILWWLAMAAVCTFVLAKTRYGNWILAVGGDANTAKNVGVPVKRVKIALFVLTAFCSCLFVVLQVCDIGSTAADRGLQKKFEAIIAAIIGRTLLTGGYGSVVGTCFGTLIFGVVQIGITYTNVSSDWFRVFLSVMLLIAVLFNHYVCRRVSQAQ